MASINQVVFTGRVASDPIITDGQYNLYGSFRLAVSSYFKTANSDKSQEETFFINCKFSNRIAEIVRNFVSKGSPVGVTGQLREEFWVDKKTGEQKSALVVRVDNLSLFETKQQREQRESGAYYQQEPRQRQEVVQLDDAPKQYAMPRERGTIATYGQPSVRQPQRQPQQPQQPTEKIPDIDLDEIPF